MQQLKRTASKILGVCGWLDNHASGNGHAAANSSSLELHVPKCALFDICYCKVLLGSRVVGSRHFCGRKLRSNTLVTERSLDESTDTCCTSKILATANSHQALHHND
jgi:hypothetical protein